MRQSLFSVSVLLAALCLTVAWLIPFHWYPWLNFQQEWLAALAGLLVCAAALASPRSNGRWPMAALVVFALAAVPLLQLLVGQILFLSDGLMSILYLVALAGAIAVGAAFGQDERRGVIDALFGALLAAAFCSTAVALIQWLDLGPIAYVVWIPPGQRPMGNISQPNHLAVLTAMGLIALMWFYETERISLRVLALGALVLLGCMALTRARAGWLIMLALAIGWFLLRRRTELRLPLRGVAIGLLAFVAFTMLVGPASGWFGTTAPVALTERVQGGGGRLRIWAAILDALWQSPWTGYGWSQASHAGLIGSERQFTGESMLRNSHSFPMDLLVWNGIPLGSTILVLIAFWWVQQLRRCDSVERGALLGMVGIVFVHSLFEFPFEYLYFLIPCGLFVGLLEGLPVEGAVRLGVHVPRAVMATLVSTLAAFTAWILVEYVEVQDASSNNRLVAAKFAARADLPDVILLDEPREYMRFWRTEAKPDMSAKELAFMRSIALRNPSPPSLLRYATALGVNGAAADSARMLVSLCNMHRKERCDEGRKSWALLQARYPSLLAVDFPPAPANP